MKKRVLLALLAVAVALVAILCFTVPGAAEGGSDVSLSIYGKSLALKDGVYINYYVKVEGAEKSLADNVKMLFFTVAPGADGYTVGNPDGKSADNSGYDEETGCYVVRYTNLTIKQMTDVIYSVAYLDTGAGIVYSAPCKYSIAQYAYNKAGDAAEGALVKEMMELGGAAQERFDHHTDDLASATHYMVRLTGATFEDGFDFGLYPAGATVTLTSGMTNAAGEVFGGWKNGNSIISHDLNYTFTVEEDVTLSRVFTMPFEYAIADDQVTIREYTGEVENVFIPDKINGYPVTAIGPGAFSHKYHVQSISLPAGLTVIDEEAFWNCSALECIEIPASVTSIGTKAFYQCFSLRSVTFAEGSLCASLGEEAFLQCTSLQGIEIPALVTCLPEEVFWECTNLKSVTFADGSRCESIGAFALHSCMALETLEIPASLREIDPDAWGPFESLSTLYIGDLASWCALSFDDPFLNPIRFVRKDVYVNGEKLRALEIPAGVTSIGDYAFAESYITSLTFAEGSQCTSIGKNAFDGCRWLESVTLPEGLKSIGDKAFHNCWSLGSVEIPESVTTVGADAFAECDELTIYCKASEAPAGWNEAWNSSNRPVIWDYQKEK